MIKNKNFIFRIIFIVIVIMILFNLIFYSYKKNSKINLDNIKINEDEILFDSLTLKQKIGQMIIVRGDYSDINFNKINIGGIFLDKQGTIKNYKNVINEFQNSSKIRLFVSTDLEGAWNPFTKEENYKFPFFSDIKNKEEAYNVGKNHGLLLKETGFNLNFAPVSEYSDKTYNGRAFTGNSSEIENKIQYYIKGLQENVFGTCKHYPGKGMINNLHLESDIQEISGNDLYLFEVCLRNNISAIMIGHQIVKGELDSNGSPSSVSSPVISSINESNVLIISDDINMMGIRKFYPEKINLYTDLINSGENIILDLDISFIELSKLLDELEKEVIKGKIDEKKINESVKKILIKKGYKLV